MFIKLSVKTFQQQIVKGVILCIIIEDVHQFTYNNNVQFTSITYNNFYRSLKQELENSELNKTMKSALLEKLAVKIKDCKEK